MTQVSKPYHPKEHDAGVKRNGIKINTHTMYAYMNVVSTLLLCVGV
jgi:hypothetical protein